LHAAIGFGNHVPQRKDSVVFLPATEGCLVLVVVTHASEALHLFPWMHWGEEQSVGTIWISGRRSWFRPFSSVLHHKMIMLDCNTCYIHSDRAPLADEKCFLTFKVSRSADPARPLSEQIDFGMT
jgi:hypothetical protein